MTNKERRALCRVIPPPKPDGIRLTPEQVDTVAPGLREQYERAMGRRFEYFTVKATPKVADQVHRALTENREAA